MNVVFLIGNLGSDPEIRYLPSGTQIAKMRLAVNETWFDKETSQKQVKTNWINLSAFGRTAEICGRFVKKGHKIAIRGSLEYREWTDSKDGTKRSALDVRVMELEMLTPKREGGMPDQASSAPPAKAGFDGYGSSSFSQDASDLPISEGPDDDIPF